MTNDDTPNVAETPETDPRGGDDGTTNTEPIADVDLSRRDRIAEHLPAVYCHLRTIHCWIHRPDAAGDRETFACLRCDERRTNPPGTNERPVAWKAQQRAKARARRQDIPDDTHRTAWAATVALSGLLIAGTLVAHDRAALTLVALLGAVLLLPVAVLHTLAGGNNE